MKLFQVLFHLNSLNTLCGRYFYHHSESSTFQRSHSPGKLTELQLNISSYVSRASTLQHMICPLPSETLCLQGTLYINNCNATWKVIYTTISRMCKYFPGSWLSQWSHFLENYLFPVPLLKSKVNYLFDFHLKLYLLINNHFPRWSIAFNEFAKFILPILQQRKNSAALLRSGY